MVEVELRCCKGRRYNESVALSYVGLCGIVATVLLYFACRATATGDASINAHYEFELQRCAWHDRLAGSNNTSIVHLYAVHMCVSSTFSIQTMRDWIDRFGIQAVYKWVRDLDCHAELHVVPIQNRRTHVWNMPIPSKTEIVRMDWLSFDDVNHSLRSAGFSLIDCW